MIAEAKAYKAGWLACMNGVDGRYVMHEGKTEEEKYAWLHGWLDAMEAEDDEQPLPECAGYGKAA